MTTPTPAETERAVRMLLAHRIDAAIARHRAQHPAEPAMRDQRIGMRAVLGIVLPSGDDQDLVVYRAAHGDIPLGTYTTAAAARAHCEDLLRRESPTAVPDWAGDVTEPDETWELFTAAGSVPYATVTPITVASAYDPEAEA